MDDTAKPRGFSGADSPWRIDGGRRTRLLSPREREILALLARGLTGEQIAGRLVLSPETIRTHIRNARAKMGAMMDPEALMRHEQGTYSRLLEQWAPMRRGSAGTLV